MPYSLNHFIHEEYFEFFIGSTLSNLASAGFALLEACSTKIKITNTKGVYEFVAGDEQLLH